MKRLLAKSILLMSIILMITSCIGPFYEDDYGKSVTLPVGTPFEIRLEGNPDSDFNWQIASLDTTVVKMVLQPSYKPFNKIEHDGGLFSYYFQTTGHGRTAIRMIYIKDGHTDGKPAKTYKLEIDCKI